MDGTGGGNGASNKLLSLVEIKLFDLQKEYNILLKKGPYEYNTSDSSDSE